MATATESTQRKAPRITIGMPVYNGEKYLRATVDSLLAQTYTDFELIVSDNASTDSTEQICREYAAKDPRFIYVRNSRNLGPAANYNVSMDLARSELFKWCAADDVYGPDCIKRLIEVLDANPDAAASYARTKIINEDGDYVRDYDCELNLSAPRPWQRLAALIFVKHRNHGAHEIWSVMRLDMLRDAGHKQALVRADSVMLVRIALRGKLVRLEEFHFFNRDHAKRSSRYLGKREVRADSKLSEWLGVGPLPNGEWWDERLKGKILFPDWRVMQQYYLAVAQTRLSLYDRITCHLVLAAFVVKHVPKLVRDVLIAAEQFTRRTYRRLTSSGKPTPTSPSSSSTPLSSRPA
jgi:glycosyltransferase involved in cell wall biosynthesis